VQNTLPFVFCEQLALNLRRNIAWGFSRPLAGKMEVHLRAKICLVPTYTINKPWRFRCSLPDRAHGIAPRIERHASVDRGATLELRVD
jgi:hypothetical protein